MGDVDVASPAIPTHVSIDYRLAHSRSAPVGALSGVTANFTTVGCMCLSMLCVCVCVLSQLLWSRWHFCTQIGCHENGGCDSICEILNKIGREERRPSGCMDGERDQLF